MDAMEKAGQLSLPLIYKWQTAHQGPVICPRGEAESGTQ